MGTSVNMVFLKVNCSVSYAPLVVLQSESQQFPVPSHPPADPSAQTGKTTQMESQGEFEECQNSNATLKLPTGNNVSWHTWH